VFSVGRKSLLGVVVGSSLPWSGAIPLSWRKRSSKRGRLHESAFRELACHDPLFAKRASQNGMDLIDNEHAHLELPRRDPSALP
jgi:hypothetical protein